VSERAIPLEAQNPQEIRRGQPTISLGSEACYRIIPRGGYVDHIFEDSKELGLLEGDFVLIELLGISDPDSVSLSPS
jgi:hypothetical protein